jgi:hypothetical protein
MAFIFDAKISPETKIWIRACRAQSTSWLTLAKYIGVGQMAENDSVVAIFTDHIGAEEAIKELQKSGFDMKKLSIVGKDYHTEEHVVGYYNLGERVASWGKAGAFWGWICFPVHSRHRYGHGWWTDCELVDWCSRNSHSSGRF